MTAHGWRRRRLAKGFQRGGFTCVRVALLPDMFERIAAEAHGRGVPLSQVLREKLEIAENARRELTRLTL